MLDQVESNAWRTLIISSHPLFGKGLHKVLGAHPYKTVQVVGIVPDIDQALKFLEISQPDLVILDCDDEYVNEKIFLRHFVEGGKRLRVVLLSLKEGASQAVVYDRRILSAAEIDTWL
jgi:DNA-binding NarL/FixJ family response regulator